MNPTVAPDPLTRPRRLRRAALVPILVWVVAVGAWAVRHDPTLDKTGVRLGEGVATDIIPVELGPATVVVP